MGTDAATNVETIDTMAKLIENHGALVIFSIVSGFINAFFIIQLARGKLVPYKIYKKAVDEADRLQHTMETERNNVMDRLLGFVGGLKAGAKEGEGNANSRRK